MANITEELIHGYINFTHTSHLTPYYPPANLPTPWPLLVCSVLISLVISCFNFKAAMTSLGNLRNGVRTVRDHPKSPWARMKAHPVGEHELESLQRPKTNEPPPPYTSAENYDNSDFAIPANDDFSPYPSEEPLEAIPPPRIIEPPKEETWDVSPRRKALDIAFVIYSTYRAAAAFTIELLGLLDKRTPSGAPSNLLLILVSIQILLSNVSFPRQIRLLLTIDTLLIALAYTTAAYAPLSNHRSGSNSYFPLATSGPAYPSYGELNITGGACATYASNCRQQAKHWIEVGCGNWTRVIDYEDNDDDDNPTTGFFYPYATSGDINTSMNPLNIVETVIFVFGTIWLLSSAWQIYEIRYVIWPRSRNRQKPKRGECANALMGMMTLFGIMGAFVACLMSIGGHMSQALGTHHSVFIDSFGPMVSTNQTYGEDSYGYNNTLSTQYWGNSTSWSDCFVVENPKSGNGWWSEWVEQNRGRLWRIPAGV
jgi:hypothetical protein